MINITNSSDILLVLGRENNPKGDKIDGRFTGTDSHDLGTTLDPLLDISDDSGPE